VLYAGIECGRLVTAVTGVVEAARRYPAKAAFEQDVYDIRI
jgi:hypothetical protein